MVQMSIETRIANIQLDLAGVTDKNSLDQLKSAIEKHVVDLSNDQRLQLGEILWQRREAWNNLFADSPAQLVRNPFTAGAFYLKPPVGGS